MGAKRGPSFWCRIALTFSRALTHIYMRPTIYLDLRDDLDVKALSFDQWPIVPAQIVDGKLVTEPTPPSTKEWLIRDTEQDGLAVRVTPRFASWEVRRKRPQGSESWRKKLGKVKTMSPTEARKAARAWLAQVEATGKNPDHERRKVAQAETEIRQARKYTFGDLYLDFIKHGEERVQLKQLRPTSVVDYRSVVKWLDHQPIWTLSLADLNADQVGELMGPWFAAATQARIEKSKLEPGQPRPKHLSKFRDDHSLPLDLAAAWKALRHGRAAWNWTKARKQTVNPFTAWAKGKKLPPVPRRETMLKTDQETGQAWLKELVAQRDSKDPLLAVMADYVLVATLWGGRKTETAFLRWVDVDFGDRCARFIGEHTKNGQDHWVPLTAWAEQILVERHARSQEQGWPTGPLDPVFYSPDAKDFRIGDYRPLTRLLKKQTGEWIRLHDLRRTLASSVFGLAKDLGTVAVALGHKSGMEVTAGYVQRQEALNALREIYGAREKKLRVWIGLDQAPKTDELTDTQRMQVQNIQMMLQMANLGDLTPEQLGALLAKG